MKKNNEINNLNCKDLTKGDIKIRNPQIILRKYWVKSEMFIKRTLKLLNRYKKYIFLTILTTLLGVSLFLLIKFLLEPTAKPQDVKLTNITDQSVTISWTTDEKPTKGSVYYSRKDNYIPTISRIFTSNRKDERDFLTEEWYGEKGSRRYYTHYVTLLDLEPETEYFLRIRSGNKLYKIEQIASVKTSKTLGTLVEPEEVYGRVLRENGEQPASGSIVTLQLIDKENKKSQLLSGLTKENGTYVIDIGLARTKEGSKLFNKNNSYKQEVTVESSVWGEYKGELDPQDDRPAPDIKLEGDISSEITYMRPVVDKVEEIEREMIGEVNAGKVSYYKTKFYESSGLELDIKVIKKYIVPFIGMLIIVYILSFLANKRSRKILLRVLILLSFVGNYYYMLNPVKVNSIQVGGGGGGGGGGDDDPSCEYSKTFLRCEGSTAVYSVQEESCESGEQKVSNSSICGNEPVCEPKREFKECKGKVGVFIITDSSCNTKEVTGKYLMCENQHYPPPPKDQPSPPSPPSPERKCPKRKEFKGCRNETCLFEKTRKDCSKKSVEVKCDRCRSEEDTELQEETLELVSGLCKEGNYSYENEDKCYYCHAPKIEPEEVECSDPVYGNEVEKVETDKKCTYSGEKFEENGKCYYCSDTGIDPAEVDCEDTIYGQADDCTTTDYYFLREDTCMHCIATGEPAIPTTLTEEECSIRQESNMDIEVEKRQAGTDEARLNADQDTDGYTILTGDCDDTNGEINPAAQEVVDNIDNDCDGGIDEHGLNLGQQCGGGIGECQYELECMNGVCMPPMGAFNAVPTGRACGGKMDIDAEFCNENTNEIYSIRLADRANDPGVRMLAGLSIGTQYCICGNDPNDCDGDGFNDEAEEVFGTDPCVPESQEAYESFMRLQQGYLEGDIGNVDVQRFYSDHLNTIGRVASTAQYGFNIDYLKVGADYARQYDVNPNRCAIMQDEYTTAQDAWNSVERVVCPEMFDRMDEYARKNAQLGGAFVIGVAGGMPGQVMAGIYGAFEAGSIVTRNTGPGREASRWQQELELHTGVNDVILDKSEWQRYFTSFSDEEIEVLFRQLAERGLDNGNISVQDFRSAVNALGQYENFIRSPFLENSESFESEEEKRRLFESYLVQNGFSEDNFSNVETALVAVDLYFNCLAGANIGICNNVVSGEEVAMAQLTANSVDRYETARNLAVIGGGLDLVGIGVDVRRISIATGISEEDVLSMILMEARPDMDAQSLRQGFLERLRNRGVPDSLVERFGVTFNFDDVSAEVADLASSDVNYAFLSPDRFNHSGGYLTDFGDDFDAALDARGITSHQDRSRFLYDQFRSFLPVTDEEQRELIRSIYGNIADFEVDKIIAEYENWLAVASNSDTNMLVLGNVMNDAERVRRFYPMPEGLSREWTERFLLEGSEESPDLITFYSWMQRRQTYEGVDQGTVEFAVEVLQAYNSRLEELNVNQRIRGITTPRFYTPFDAAAAADVDAILGSSDYLIEMADSKTGGFVYKHFEGEDYIFIQADGGGGGRRDVPHLLVHESLHGRGGLFADSPPTVHMGAYEENLTRWVEWDLRRQVPDYYIGHVSPDDLMRGRSDRYDLGARRIQLMIDTINEASDEVNMGERLAHEAYVSGDIVPFLEAYDQNRSTFSRSANSLLKGHTDFSYEIETPGSFLDSMLEPRIYWNYNEAFRRTVKGSGYILGAGALGTGAYYAITNAKEVENFIEGIEVINLNEENDYINDENSLLIKEVSALNQNGEIVTSDTLSKVYFYPTYEYLGSGIKEIRFGTDGKVLFQNNSKFYRLKIPCREGLRFNVNKSSSMNGREKEIVNLGISLSKENKCKNFHEVEIELKSLGNNIEFRLYNDKNNNYYKDANEKNIKIVGLNFFLEDNANSFQYNFSKGWNLISFPFELGNNYRASDIVNEIDLFGGYATEVAKYDSGRWELYKKRGNVSFSYDDFKIEPGKAYWIKVESSIDIVFEGKILDDPKDLNLQTGWNLVGLHPGYTEEEEEWVHEIGKDGWTAKEIITEVQKEGIILDTVTRYRGGRYESYILDKSYDGSEEIFFGEDFKIEPMKGYFIRVKEGEGTFKP